jgi:TRAP-type C4-dicarboxylate transport system permease small subunit
LNRLIVWIGGGALIAACLIDTVGVIARNAGLHVRGTVELVQAAILVAGVLALLASTLAEGHAKVHLLVNRLAPGARQLLARLSALLGALFFLVLLGGGLWIAADLWDSYELSELWSVPIRWLRAICNAAFALVALAWLYLAFRRTPQ